MAGIEDQTDRLTSVLRPVRAGNGFEEALEQILRVVRLGLVPGGERLPPERELADRIGISRVTLREVLKVLQEQGLVESRRGRYGGTFVLERARTAGEDELRRRIASVDIEDTLRFREALEVGAVGLCAAHGLTMSRLMMMVEDDFAPLVPEHAQAVWVDDSAGFRRRSVSPPAQQLAGEVLACELAPGARIAYEQSPRPGLEHHLLMLEGELRITVAGQTHDLAPGDCLRYQLFDASSFETPEHCAAKYILLIV